jgi:hypothetical protein
MNNPFFLKETKMYKQRIVNHINCLRQKMINLMGLPFQDILPAEKIGQAIKEEGISFRERIFSPWVTLWAFVAQVLDPDHSCRKAVSRVIAYSVQIGLAIPSAFTGGYCRARKRLAEGLLHRLVCWVGFSLEEKAKEEDLWCGRHVKIADGSTVSMPDTPENQKEYPQHRNQAEGCGFPIARIVAIISAVTGAIWDLAFSSIHVGENPLFRNLWDQLNGGDVLLTDRGFCSYANVVSLLMRGVDSVFRLPKGRKFTSQEQKILGPGDKLITWTRPKCCPKGMSKEEFENLPESITVRLVHFCVEIPGFRSKHIYLITTLLDPVVYPLVKLAELYRIRWQCELNLRDLKTTMQMEILNGKTPQMVRKEVLAHLLAYNLIRSLMWDAAILHRVPPLRLSFKAAIQHFSVFVPIISAAIDIIAKKLITHLLILLASAILPDRPNRFEPRLKKRRPKAYGWLQQPRNELKKGLALA